MNDRIWALGAPDPEMEMIERTLREAWVPYSYAMHGRYDSGALKEIWTC